MTATPRELLVQVAGEVPCTVRFVGAGGRVFLTTHGTSAKFALARAAGGYVRAVVERPDGKRAFTQPVFVDARRRAVAARQ